MTIDVQNGRFDGWERIRAQAPAVTVGFPAHFVEMTTSNVQNSCPVDDTTSNSVYRYVDVGASISRLLKIGDPTTVSRLVVAVVVDTINRVFFGWTRPHVGIECLKAVEPSITNLDTSRSIDWKFVIGLVSASSLHSGPDIILICLTKAMQSRFCQPIDFQHFGSAFGLITATTELLAINEVGTGRSRDFGAFALAQPKNVSIGRLRLISPYYRQTKEFLARKIAEFTHGVLSVIPNRENNIEFGR